MNMSILNLKEFFCKISAKITVFRWKIAAVTLTSERKFYDNDASLVLRSLTAVSVELPAILKNIGESQKKFDPEDSVLIIFT